jgi:predicted  nucleic acid-binding Zn-ribbon protein
MEYMNQTYEAVDSQPRPVSYLNPCAIRESSIDEENYETLTEVQTQFNNIYEQLPTAGGDGDALQPHDKTNETNDLKIKKQNNADVIDESEIMKIKKDLKKTKISVTILALFVIALLVISLIAVALAVTIPQRTSIENQAEADGPQAVIAPNNPSTQELDTSTRQMITDLTAELLKLQDTVNATRRRLISEQSDLLAQTRQNFSDIGSQLGNVRSVYALQSNQLHHLIRQITNQSNATSLVNQVITLQDRSQQMQSKITEAEGHIHDLMLMQSNLQKNFNATQNNLTQVRHQISNVQNQLGINQREVGAVGDRVTAVQDQLTTTRANITSLNGQTNLIRQQLTTTQTNIAAVRSQASSLQTSLNNHLSSSMQPYQNCHQDTQSCSVSNLTNDNRRLYCNTHALNANVTVSQ